MRELRAIFNVRGHVIHDQDLALIIHHRHRVLNSRYGIFDEHHAHAVWVEAQKPQRHEFSDGVIFTISAFAQEFHRHLPRVLALAVGHVAHLIEKLIDRPDLSFRIRIFNASHQLHPSLNRIGVVARQRFQGGFKHGGAPDVFGRIAYADFRAV